MFEKRLEKMEKMKDMEAAELLAFMESDKTLYAYKLNKEQEIGMVQIAWERDELLGNGSSRVVYELSPHTVLKAAIDDEGRFQNSVEWELHEEHASDQLARILAYGKNVIVMEKVYVPADFEDLWRNEDYIFDWSDREQVETWLDEYFGITMEDIHGLFAVYRFLEDELGHTVDNGQIGFRHGTNEPVAYDYGYIPTMHGACVSEYLENFFSHCDYNTDVFLEEVVLTIQGRESELE